MAIPRFSVETAQSRARGRYRGAPPPPAGQVAQGRKPAPDIDDDVDAEEETGYEFDDDGS